MDFNLRQLERKALQGDAEAALAFVAAQARQREKTDLLWSFQVPPTQIMTWGGAPGDIAFLHFNNLSKTWIRVTVEAVHISVG